MFRASALGCLRTAKVSGACTLVPQRAATLYLGRATTSLSRTSACTIHGPSVDVIVFEFRLTSATILSWSAHPDTRRHQMGGSGGAVGCAWYNLNVWEPRLARAKRANGDPSGRFSFREVFA